MYHDFMGILTVYIIDFINNTGDEAEIQYDNVHDQWIEQDNFNKQGRIKVRYIYSLSLYTIYI